MTARILGRVLRGMSDGCHRSLSRSWANVTLSLLVWALMATAVLARPTVTPLDTEEGKPKAVGLETQFYKVRLDLGMHGAIQSMVYKPLDHELRAEDYYSTHMPVFHDVPRLADPDPITGLTRRISKFEMKRAHNGCPATYRVVKHSEDELVLELEWRNSTQAGQAWMAKIVSRRRLFFRDGSPAVRVEYELVNTDTEDRSILLDSFNSVSFGKVKAENSIFSVDGKMTDIDRAKELGSTFLLVPDIAGDWIGGVNEQGLGAAYSYDWPDVDAMQVCNWKTVGATFHTILRRRPIPAGKSIVLAYWFMPFIGFESFDGMKHDLAGGFRLDAVKPGEAAPLRVLLCSGRDRTVTVKLNCLRMEDQSAVLDETRPLALKTAETAKLETKLTLPGDGLYVLTITADDGKGTVLRMERGIELGRTRLTWQPQFPPGEKRGTRDGAENLAPPRWHSQFRTIDRAMVTEHLPFLRDHARGLVKAFFLAPVEPTLCHVRELAQRADFEYEYYAAERISNPKGSLNHKAVAELRREFRKREADVFVAFGINCDVGLKQKVFREILRRVEDGMGAVLLTEQLSRQPLVKKEMENWTKLDRKPASALAVGSALGGVQFYRLGKGRIALIPFQLRYYRDEGERALEGWTNLAIGTRKVGIPELRWRGFEYSYAHLADLVRWAAGKESGVGLPSASLDGRNVSVEITNTGPALAGKLSVAARTRRWEVCARGTASVQVPADRSTHQVTLDVLPDSGPLALELHVHNAQGKVVAFGSVGVEVPEQGIASLKITCEPRTREAQAPGTCQVDMAGKAVKGQLDVTVLDRFDRVVLKTGQTVALENGKARVEIDLSPIKPVCVFHEIVADFTPEGATRRAAQASELVYLMPEQPRYRDRFVAAAAGAPERKIKHIQGMLDACRRAGITMHTHSYYDPLVFYTGGDMAGYNTLSPRRKHQKNIMEPPVYVDEETVAKNKAQWQKDTRELLGRGARMVLIDDERRLSGEYDWNPKTVAAFREHLKQRYGAIAKLNKTWGTNFADFPSVVPKTRAEIGFPGCENVAPWLEFRMFVGDLLARNHTQLPAEWAAEISPKLSVGELGMYLPSPEWPVDWSKYAKCYRDTGHYRDPMLTEYFRSFAPGCNHGSWQGYGMTEISPGRRIELWQCFLDGGHWVWFWEMRCPGTLGYAVCTSDLRVTNGYQALADEEFPDIMGGLDQMIIASKFTDDKIALAYSYPSWLTDTSAHGATSKGILEELGYQFTSVALDDVAAGRLQKERYRLLILQQTTCVSPEQMAGVRRFAETGGRVLFIGRTGWRDLVGSPHAKGSLADDLIGIDTSEAAPLNGELASVEEALPIRVAVEKAKVTPTAAQVLASAQQEGSALPLLTKRAVGKGQVFWLNSTLSGHSAYHTGGIAGEKSLTLTGPEAIRNSHFSIFDMVVQDAGIWPRARVEQGGRPVYGGQSWYYVSPTQRSMYVARYVPGGMEGPATVRLARKGHVYDLRTQKYFGLTDSVEHTFPNGRVQVYGILDCRVTGLSAKLSSDTAKPGDVLKLACTVVTDGKPADLHGIRVSITDPTGKPMEAHKTVLLARDGKAAMEIPLALNQPTGQYTVTLMDCVSGTEAKASFRVVGRE